jgi:hypothetical protein
MMVNVLVDKGVWYSRVFLLVQRARSSWLSSRWNEDSELVYGTTELNARFEARAHQSGIIGSLTIGSLHSLLGRVCD